ncbi:hypothetical protein HXX76_003101 [Chlamydomonas incerta]|uniref:MYND-type domain-containing protein n=1 Tax=Chlamydomonas incerta TaxID=51695 RepID=A0A835W8K0_CHLIN|nr:hypothetical protein HXX76_003101 [Chlamydomonas incerta]|eukprot:KAG2441479.1 hypothetical protein HXX76_003101 [Chlamydomonas incerta]
MATSQLWYVPHRPDLLCLAPCDNTDPVPGPGCMFLSIPDKLQTQQPQRKDDTAWKHPKATGFATAFGDIAKQQPRVVRCACGKSPCALRAVAEGAGVAAEDFIPADWHSKFELPPAGPEHAAPESRRVQALDAYLQCTGKAEKELPVPEGKEMPEEEDIKAHAEVMLTDFFKGRVCHACNLPSTKMMRCGNCHEARYCSRDCQRKHWSAEHKAACAARFAVARAQEPGSAELGKEKKERKEGLAAQVRGDAEAAAEEAAAQ